MSAFLKLNKRTKYLILDIAPTIIFSQYFLSNIGYKVYGYEEVRKEKNIDIKKSLSIMILYAFQLGK